LKIANTAARLKQIMNEDNLKQVDIVNKAQPYCKKYDVKLNKSDISQYVSGKFEPSQDKLVILAMALDVSEAWLMGFDVPKERIEVNILYTDEELQAKENNKAIADLVIRMRNDKDFLDLIIKINELEPQKLSSLLALLR